MELNEAAAKTKQKHPWRTAAFEFDGDGDGDEQRASFEIG